MATLKLGKLELEIFDSRTCGENTILATGGGVYVLSGKYISKMEPPPVDIHEVTIREARYFFPPVVPNGEDET